MKIWDMCSACWLPQAINTHSEYAITAFPLQKRLHECAPMLRYITRPVLFTATTDHLDTRTAAVHNEKPSVTLNKV